MKLDSEKQRKELLEMLSVVPISTTIGECHKNVIEADRILDPIRTAEIERVVVPIESLAPDPSILELKA